jgi:putative protease
MSTPRPHKKPEVLAPAGDQDALLAALWAGADSVYFGLSDGFNARARAGNFSSADLAATVARIHRAGAKAYLTLNTLVFEPELAAVERAIRHAAEAGVDALIVQDPAVALLARALCPALEVHASTQMTISSAEGARFARSLGATRLVVPRELSVEEIAELRAGTELELEVFIHGALCVSWSGQCLTSQAWGGRSANRGECAQSCRMPYDLVVDGAVRELGDVKYLLSPKDLAGLRAVEQLCALGVHGLKIEGRQKNAQYVATATHMYRAWVDAVAAGERETAGARGDLLRASLSYTRGFGDGFLGGNDHQTLVEGRFPKHRGVFLGVVARVEGNAVEVERDGDGHAWTGALAAPVRAGGPQGIPSAALHGFEGSPEASDGPRAAALEPRAGMGVVFDRGRPEEDEQGGPIFGLRTLADGWRLEFGTPGPDLQRVAAGDLVWVTSDPAITREVERALAQPEPSGRIPVDLSVRGLAGERLRVRASAAHVVVEVESMGELAAASGAGLDEELVRAKLAAFGGTPLRLAGLELAGLAAGLHLPVSELKTLRREIVARLVPAIERGPHRDVARESQRESQIERLRNEARARTTNREPPAGSPRLLALCRTDAQLEAALECGLPEVELDWMELVGLARAVERARAAGVRVTLATTRVQKPGEESYDARLAALAPDAVLVRHWGALMRFQDERSRPVLHGDFSLNVTNSLTAAELFARGLDTLTAAHDLDERQLFALLEASSPERFTLVLHHRIATFHTEHCVYSHLLSRGRDFRTCGRPCESHRVSLRDHLGHEHPVIVDVGCRNTVFNAEVQSAAALVPELLRRGLRRFRVEFVREERDAARAILRAYAELLAGTLTPEAAARRAGARAHVGVSSQPMALLG